MARHFRCQQGHLHWGEHGAAGLFIICRKGDETFVLLTQRAGTMESGTWGIPGGAIEPGEHPYDAALRESTEELGELPLLNYHGTFINDHNDWAYHTILVQALDTFMVDLNWEASEARWVPVDKIRDLNLHPGMTVNLDEILAVVRNKKLPGVVIP